MTISSRTGFVALFGLVLLLAAGVFGLERTAGAAAPAGVLPLGWAVGGSASSPQSQVTAASRFVAIRRWVVPQRFTRKTMSAKH